MRGPENTTDRFGPIWVYLIALAFLFVRFGYGFATGDQDEVLPFLIHTLDPSFFTNDWFVQTQAGAFSVRTYFVWALVPFCRVFPIESVVLFVYLLLWLAIASGAFRLGIELTNSKSAAAIAVVASLGVLHKWGLGSNDMVYSMLVPEMASWAIALPAIRYWVIGRRSWGAALLGIATWFQLLVGLLIFAVLCLERLWQMLEEENRAASAKAFLRTVGWFSLLALPAIIPIALQQLSSPAASAEPSIFYIVAPFRNPFHHMLFSFGAKSIIRFTILILGGAAALWWLTPGGQVKHSGFLFRLGSTILVVCAVTAIFTEWQPVLLIAKFQAFKLTVLMKLLVLILISAVIVGAVPDRLVALGERLLEPGRIRVWMLAGVLVAMAIGWNVLPGAVDGRLVATKHARSDLGKMERWIESHADRNVVFAIPPSISSFRSNAKRAIVVNYAAFPYNDADMIEWYERIQAVAPVGEVESGLGLKPKLDAAFSERTADEWRELARTYEFRFVLRRGDLSGLRVVRSVGDWKLYSVE